MNDNDKLKEVQNKLKELMQFAQAQGTIECMLVSQNLAVLIGASYADNLNGLSEITEKFAISEVSRLKASLN